MVATVLAPLAVGQQAPKVVIGWLSTAPHPLIRDFRIGLKELGYGAGYKYAHDFEEKVTEMECLPENLKGRQWYFPTEEGVEKRIRERLAQIKARKEKMREG